MTPVYASMQAITQEHVLQNWAALKAQQAQQVKQYNQETLVDPTLSYFNETLQQHLKGLQPNITAVRLTSHSDPDHRAGQLDDYYYTFKIQGRQLRP